MTGYVYGVTSIVGGSMGYWYDSPPQGPRREIRLDCGCGAKAWQRHKPHSPCAYCGREPEPAWDARQ